MKILKPYFNLEKVEAAVIDLASALYGIRFVNNKGILFTIPK